MRNWGFISFVIVIVILLDFYIFLIVKTLTQGTSARLKPLIFSGYWGICIVALVLFALLPYFSKWPVVRNYIFASVIGFFLAKLLAALFFLVDDARRLIQWVAGKLFFRGTEGDSA